MWSIKLKLVSSIRLLGALLAIKHSLNNRFLNELFRVMFDFGEVSFGCLFVCLLDGRLESLINLLLPFFHHHLLQLCSPLLHGFIFGILQKLLELRIVLVLLDLVSQNFLGILIHLVAHANWRVFESKTSLNSKLFAVDAVFKQPLVAVLCVLQAFTD